MSVTVITPTVPGRTQMLGEAIDSVMLQSVKPQAHLIGVDVQREGPAAVRNRLSRVDTTWLAFLDDDDLLYRHHLETLLGHDADVIYPRCDRTHEVVWGMWRPFDPELITHSNYIPVTTLVRTQAFWDVGGFPDEVWEDWGLWKKLHAAGAKFLGIDEETWTYRTGDWASRTRSAGRPL